MDETMTEPQRTAPFAPFEWLLSGRYLRARRKEGFISVIAGFSFLGIMLGVATLIIVMAVMNGFRKELLDKILGLNGHLLVQPLESPLTDWKDVADRVSQVQGIRLAAPVVDTVSLARRLLAGRVPRVSLSSLSDFFGTSVQPCHRALPDAQATAEILISLIGLAQERGVDLIGPGRAGVFVNLVPVFSAIRAVALIAEPFAAFHAVALALVIGGIWLAQRR